MNEKDIQIRRMEQEVEDLQAERGNLKDMIECQKETIANQARHIVMLMHKAGMEEVNMVDNAEIDKLFKGEA